MKQLFWETVNPLLKEILQDLITESIFMPFRLVGGTALSLQIGHRMSVDIDLFTDADYGSIDYNEIRSFLENKYPYCTSRNLENVSFGTYFEVGYSKDNYIKIDVFYTDEFIEAPLVIENMRMATINEIIAMKLDVVLRGGRKKDFWDLHYFIDTISLNEMVNLYQKRYPYNDTIANIKQKLIDFNNAENDFEPNCLLGKSWEIIKLDFYETFNKK
jgi:predicted nucleotidyltransferase component of viral defense system